MNKFHYYVTSSASTDLYPDNIGGKFRNNMANTMHLEGAWEVGLFSITCQPHGITYLTADNAKLALHFYNPAKSLTKLYGLKTVTEIFNTQGTMLAPAVHSEAPIFIGVKIRTVSDYTLKHTLFNGDSNKLFTLEELILECNDKLQKVVSRFKLEGNGVDWKGRLFEKNRVIIYALTKEKEVSRY